MKDSTIAFIGAGNMASSIIGGLLDSGHNPASIRASDPSPACRESLHASRAVAVFDDNSAAIEGADVVILAVKPQVMAEVLQNAAKAIQTNKPVLISIAAGITVASMQSRLGDTTAVVRCMPNTPALLRCGASGLYANEQVTPQQRQLCDYILSAVGTTCWVEQEQQLDAITALSGSGPAYFFLFAEAMIEAGVAQGLSPDTASTLALQTALGAARMALEDGADLPELRRRVTSPGGTTERAINRFEQDKLRLVVANAMGAAADRAAEMAEEMG